MPDQHPAREIVAAPGAGAAGNTVGATVRIVMAPTVRVAFLHANDAEFDVALAERVAALYLTRASSILRRHGLHIEQTNLDGEITDDPVWYEIEQHGELMDAADIETVLEKIRDARAKYGFPRISSAVLPVAFCKFHEGSVSLDGETLKGWGGPAVVLMVNNQGWDNVTMLHEIGHAAGLYHDNVHIDGDKSHANIMYSPTGAEKPVRNQLLPDQRRAIATALFTR